MSIRLLNTTTGRFEEKKLRSVRYAALSHVWTYTASGEPDEQSYREVYNIARKHKKHASILPFLSTKIQHACAFAKSHGFQYIWIDTCCIDQTSSAELSRSINSMYEWYGCCGACYAFLGDVRTGENPVPHGSEFRRSKWFKRGWTLQELIAPHNVIFLCQSWSYIGTKHSMVDIVEQETSVDREVLLHRRMTSEVSVAQRMRWSAGRTTSLVEDGAYCLIGIFGVNLIPVYGEKDDAFVRLQEAILKLDPDQSIFAWGARLSDVRSFPLTSLPDITSRPLAETYMLAQHPGSYGGRSKQLAPIRSLSREDLSKRLRAMPVGYPEYTYTSSGLRTRFPMIIRPECPNQWLAILSCTDGDGNILGLILNRVVPDRAQGHSDESVPAIPLMYVGVMSESRQGFHRTSECCRLVPLSDLSIAHFLDHHQVKPDVDVYVTHRPLGRDLTLRRRNAAPQDLVRQGSRPIVLTLSPWSKAILQDTHAYSADVKSTQCVVELTSSKDSQDRIVLSLHVCEYCTSGGRNDDREKWLQVSVLSESSAADCAWTHIQNWRFEDGRAHYIYPLTKLNNVTSRALRLSLSIGAPDDPTSNVPNGPDSVGISPDSVHLTLDIELLIPAPTVPVTAVGTARTQHLDEGQPLLLRRTSSLPGLPQAANAGQHRRVAIEISTYMTRNSRRSTTQGQSR